MCVRGGRFGGPLVYPVRGTGSQYNVYRIQAPGAGAPQKATGCTDWRRHLASLFEVFYEVYPDSF